MHRSFPLAPMDLVMWVITLLFFALTGGFLFFGLRQMSGLVAVGVFLLGMLAVVWLWSRPSALELSHTELAVRWPVRNWTMPVSDLRGARTMTLREFKEWCGFGMRIGVGGLFGQFGWIKSSKRGLIDCYISRISGFVIVERANGNPILFTPEDPAAFVAAIQAATPVSR